MSDVKGVYVFGDQTFEYSKELRQLVHSNKDPLLISFFEQVYFALRAEIGNLPQHQRHLLGKFANFAELAAFDRTVSLHPSLDQALTCAYQLALFIQ